MKKKPFYFEIKDVLIQFISAFNDVVINRYNSSRVVKDQIAVRYVYSPKQRALHNLLNKSQHISLPAVVVSIGSISRDNSRVFNKIRGTYDAQTSNDDPKALTYDNTPMPVPVNIDINMSIMTKYQNDVDQILSNFIPYSNPYIVVSWKLPSDLSTLLKEIRTEIEWSGNVTMDYPTDVQPNNPARISADTSFTVKSWLFPAGGTKVGPNILYAYTDMYPVTGISFLE